MVRQQLVSTGPVLYVCVEFYSTNNILKCNHYQYIYINFCLLNFTAFIKWDRRHTCNEQWRFVDKIIRCIILDIDLFEGSAVGNRVTPQIF
jgi:hypothetical protein